MNSMSSKERNRLMRMRRRGEITADTPYDQIRKALDNYKPQPRSTPVGPVSQVLRSRLKRKFGITPTQLLQYSEERQAEILVECSREVDGRTLVGKLLKSREQC